MRFTVLLTDRYDTSDLRLLLNAGFKARSYVTCWGKVFYPDTRPIVEYVKIARLFQLGNHFVLAVLIKDYLNTPLAVAHYIKSGRDLASWVSTQPTSATLRTMHTIENAVFACGHLRRLRGATMRFLRQDLMCCARLGVVTIEPVRHSETGPELAIRVFATEAAKYFGPVAFRTQGVKPSVVVTIKDKRLRKSLQTLANVLRLNAHTLAVTGNAKALLEGKPLVLKFPPSPPHVNCDARTVAVTGNAKALIEGKALVHIFPAHPAHVLGKRKRPDLEEHVPIPPPNVREQNVSTSSVLGKRKRGDYMDV